jgi:formylglycine-generating enzyme required for sulfatase activity
MSRTVNINDNPRANDTIMKHIKIKLMVMAGAVALGLDTAPAQAQAPVIASFGRNGELVCTNLSPGTVASVEWAASVTGPWTNTWADLAAVTTDTNGAIRVSVPMFYRVRAFPVPSNMVWIQAGQFVMGSPTNEVDRQSDEGPQTRVTLTRGFYIGRYEVTQGEYLSVIGSNPSYFTGDTNRPVEQVSWYDATNYCVQLTAQEWTMGRLPTGWAYRLPTEAEYEYASRAGSTNRFSYGEDPGYTQLGDYAWYSANSGGTTHSVGRKLPNRWGLYDMNGNVWEWCLDWYVGVLPGGSVTDPHLGLATGSNRATRGGGWGDDRSLCRSAFRSHSAPAPFQAHGFGFRVVLAPGQ